MSEINSQEIKAHAAEAKALADAAQGISVKYDSRYSATKAGYGFTLYIVGRSIHDSTIPENSQRAIDDSNALESLYSQSCSTISTLCEDVAGLTDELKTLRDFVDLMLSSTVRYGTYDADKLGDTMDELALMIGKRKAAQL